MDDLSRKLRDLAAPVLADEQVELVDLELKGTQGSRIIRFLVAAECGVNLDTCARVSRRLSDELDTHDVVPGRFRLEVSSPGIGRPLSTLMDFRRNLNRDIDLRWDDDGNERILSGVLANVSDDGVEVKLEQDVELIPWSKIKHGKLRLPW